MKIIERPGSFDVTSDDGSISKQFFYDDNPSRRAISGKVNRKRALIEARTFAGRGAELITATTSHKPPQQ